MIGNGDSKLRQRIKQSSLRGRSVRRRIFVCMQPILLMLVLAIGLVLFLNVGQTHEALIAFAESWTALIGEPSATLGDAAAGGPLALLLQSAALLAMLTLFSGLLVYTHAAFTEKAVADTVAVQAEEDLDAVRAEGGAGGPVAGGARRGFWEKVDDADYVVEWVRRNVSTLLFATPWIWLLAAGVGALLALDARIDAAEKMAERFPGQEDLGGFAADLLRSVFRTLCGVLVVAAALPVLLRKGSRRLRSFFRVEDRAKRQAYGLIGIGLLAFVVAPLLSPVTAYGVFHAVGPFAASLTALYVVVSLLILFGFLRVDFEQPYSIVLLGFVVLLVSSQVDWVDWLGWIGVSFFGVLAAIVLGFIAYGFGLGPKTTILAVAGASVLVVAGGVLIALQDEDAPLAETETESEPPSETPRRVESVFADWLLDAPRDDAGEKIPVFVVSARGGGAYAAAAASTLLARLECAPSEHRFHERVFAVSSVSGGSVGAVMFRDMIRSPHLSDLCGDAAPLDATMLALLTENHLGASMAALPSDQLVKIADAAFDVGAIDYSRFRGLARSFMGAQYDARGGDWATDPEARGPYLVLNTTWSETGFRVAYADFSLKPISDDTLYSFDDLSDLLAPYDVMCPTQERADGDLFGEAIALDDRRLDEVGFVRDMEQALASAAFPLMLPAHVRCRRGPGVDPERPPVWNFVDGGYSDSTGAITASEIVVALQDFLDSCLSGAPAPSFRADCARLDAVELADVEFHLIILTDDRPNPSNLAAVASGTRLRDSGAIISTVLKLRALISNVAVLQVYERVADANEGRDALTITIHEVRIGDQLLELPLGWTLSSSAARLIGASIGDADWVAGAAQEREDAADLLMDCRSSERLDADPALRADCAAALVEHNSCRLADIEAVIAGDGRAPPARCDR